MSYFKEKNIENIDYKDTETLSKFLNPYGRIMSSRWTGVSSKYQRKLARAIKQARFMALLPYVDR